MTEFPQDELIVIGGGNRGAAFPLSRPTVSIGRSSQNDICLSWDPRVSRSHARLVRHDAVWLLEDLGSTNGTFVETDRIAGPTPLEHGNRIRAGRIWLQMVLDRPPLARAVGADDNDTSDQTVAEGFSSFDFLDEDLAQTEQIAAEPVVTATAVTGAQYIPATPSQVEEQPSVSHGLLDRILGWVSRRSEPKATAPVEAEAVEAPAKPPPPPVPTPPLEAEASQEVAEAEPPSHPSGLAYETVEAILSSELETLQLEIRALASDEVEAPDTDALKQLLGELDFPSHLGAQMKETLGSTDVYISVTAPAGSQAELLTYAGQVVSMLEQLPAYREVLVTPNGDRR